MKIASWNVNSLKVRLTQVLAYLEDAQLDVLCLQETKMTDEAFPTEYFINAGWHIAFFGQKTYNGVAIISRFPITDVVLNNPFLEDPQARLITATIQNIRIVNAYIVNGQAPGTEKFTYKMKWLAALHQHMQVQMAQFDQTILLGDFNIAPEDQDVHDPARWAGSNLVSVEERNQYQGLLGLGLHDSYRLFEQAPQSFSWWDYRAAGFRRNAGLRIDLILISEPLKSLCASSIIDKTPREHEQPSDHAPVIISFDFDKP